MRISIIPAVALLLLGASAANSQTPLVITQGSATFDGFSVDFDVGNGTWTMQGNTGEEDVLGSLPAGSILVFPGEYSGFDTNISYTPYPGGPTYLNLVDGGFPAGEVALHSYVTVTHAGTYTTPFTGFIRFECGPCQPNGPPELVDYLATGHGFLTSTWAAAGPPGYFYLSEPATYTFVPEPGSLALLCLGLAGLGFAQRKRMSQLQLLDADLVTVTPCDTRSPRTRVITPSQSPGVC